MAVLATTHPTLADLTSRTDPDGRIAAVVELLTQDTSILEDMTWVEGNLPTGHRSTVRTGLPEPTWRKMYGGVQPTKSTTAQVTDNTGMLEDYAEIDKALADLNGNTDEFMLSESRAHITGFAHKLTRTIIYGNEGSEPEAFTGFSPRYNTISGNPAADNVIDAGGTGTDNASIWLVGWGPNTVHGIIPKGSTAGLQVTPKGQVTIENIDGNGGRMEGYRTHFRWDAGLTVRDWRYVVRIANIDKSLLTKDASTGADLLSFMDDALERIPTDAEGATRLVWYMPRHVRAFLRKQMKNAVKNSTLTMEQIQGRYVPTYDGIPIKRLDVLGADEARVV